MGIFDNINHPDWFRAPQEMLGLDPTVKYRASMLPLVRTKDDKIEFGVPSALASLAAALLTPGYVAKGGQYDQETVANTAQALSIFSAPLGLGGAPRGALGMGAVKPPSTFGLSPDILKNLNQAARAAAASQGAGLGSKSINKTVRSAGATEENMSLSRNALNEMYNKVISRKTSAPATDPLIIASNPDYMRLRAEKLKNSSDVLNAAVNLKWHGSALKDLIQYKSFGDGSFEGAAKKATLESIQRNANKYGFSVTHNSGKKSAMNASSVYLQRPDIGEIRVSDHQLPMTSQREYNWEQSGGPRWNREYILDNNHLSKNLDDIFKEISE